MKIGKYTIVNSHRLNWLLRQEHLFTMYLSERSFDKCTCEEEVPKKGAKNAHRIRCGWNESLED